MFHAGHNRDIPEFNTWKQQFQYLQFLLVRGNHDKLKAYQYDELGIDLIDMELQLPPFHFVHDLLQGPENGFSICGHLHPGKIIYGPARQALRLPCFIVTEQYIILPAFSHFTGLDTSHQSAVPASYFLVSEEGIFKV